MSVRADDEFERNLAVLVCRDFLDVIDDNLFVSFKVERFQTAGIVSRPRGLSVSSAQSTKANFPLLSISIASLPPVFMK